MTQTVRDTELYKRIYAHDASHFLLYPSQVVVAEDLEDVRRAFETARAEGTHITFRSGGTSLSGQAVGDGILLDTRLHFKDVSVHADGEAVTAQPGATLRSINNLLRRHKRMLGPDPASEIAATIGGVVANNSSGMACGRHANSHETVESLRFTLPSGTTIDTADPQASEKLQALEPAIYETIIEIRDQLRSSEELTAEVERQFSIKNTMGYGLNSFLEYDDPIEIVAHLLVGSEGTLAFVDDIHLSTVHMMPSRATGLAVFPDLVAATEAVPFLASTGVATIELLDAKALKVAQGLANVPQEIEALEIDTQAALLLEFRGETEEELDEALAKALPLLTAGGFDVPFTTDAKARAALWQVRKGLYTAVAGARPPGTTALLEDVAVHVEQLADLCVGVQEIALSHGYGEVVIFGHAKDGNIHFMLTDDFSKPGAVEVFGDFTNALVDLVLGLGGTLKAEHGTGRVMAPFVEAQYGPVLYEMMVRIKDVFDPDGILNPGVIITDDPLSYLENFKPVPVVNPLFDRCVECGYCEPVCPSEEFTFTPRQRIVAQREMALAPSKKIRRLYKQQNVYGGVETCAVDGMCEIACPVGINTGDLVRAEREEEASPVLAAGWHLAAKHWGALLPALSGALDVAHVLPGALVTGATRAMRAVLGDNTVPLWTEGVPGGGPKRSKVAGPLLDKKLAASPNVDAVFFPSCLNTLFKGAGRDHPQADFQVLCALAGINLSVPGNINSLCCGTPWSSKGFAKGKEAMTEKVVETLFKETRGGAVPVVVDASSCTEGLIKALAGTGIEVIDAPVFVAQRVLPNLPEIPKQGKIVLHPTCSTAHIGSFPGVVKVAEAFAGEVEVPPNWGCCGFAGDRGMLFPGLTASATQSEAKEVEGFDGNVFASSNRPCELGMTWATGEEYRYIVSVLAERVTQ